MGVGLGNVSPPCPFRARSPNRKKLIGRLALKARSSLRKVRDGRSAGRTFWPSAIHNELFGCCVISFSFCHRSPPWRHPQKRHG